MPQYIQRKRSAGWTMPENTVYVGRPSKWGNPFKVVKIISGWRVKLGVHCVGVIFDSKREAAQFAADSFKSLVMENLEQLQADIDDLRGKNLSCWCREDEPCHARVLLELANQ